MLTLRDRLILVNALIFLVALPVLAVVLLSQLVTGLYEQLDRGLEIITFSELARVDIANGPQFEANSARPQSQLGPEGFVRLLDPQGQITGGIGAYRQTPVLQDSLAATANGLVFNQTTPTSTRLRVYTLPIVDANRTAGYIQTADDQELLLETVNRVRWSLLIGAPLTILISALLSFLTIRQALRPLTTMTHTAAKISSEALNQRLPLPRARDEVYALAIAFNATLDRLAAAFTRQRRFTANASHELRTPVTTILGQAELALSRPRSPEEYQRSLQSIQSESDRMQRLISRMLALARVESGRQPLDLSSVNLTRLIETLVDTLRPQAVEKGVALIAEVPPHLTLTTDANSLTQILLNLLENAIAHTDNGSVTLTITPSDLLRITVSDTGQGIPPEHLPHIFQPFYRVDPARSRNRGGAGLGLALTRELVQLLGGQIQVDSRSGIGVTFTLTLPVPA